MINASFPFHKRKDSSTQWIYDYSLHKWCREMGSEALKHISLKQAHISMQLNDVLFFELRYKDQKFNIKINTWFSSLFG